ncbi:putative odorant receptor 71a [Wyeomyia smithii]|uniref:putative odorant receptor 71a n=1 Tax=Wyeomyia smithii TaxID=174621 RepID=UPI002467C157|nr:putative odorant receptor 71a [Wyeomyia smithii]
MLNLQPKSSFKMMRSSINLCKVVGLWDEANRRRRPRWQVILLASSLILWYIIPSAAFMIRNEKVLLIQLKPTLELFAIIIFTVRLFVHIITQDKLQKCYYQTHSVLNEFVDSSFEDVRSILAHMQVSSERLVKYYTCGVMAQASIYGWVPAIITIFKYAVGTKIPELPSTVLEADFVFFDQKSSFWIWLPVMAISLIVQYLMVVTMSANECLLWNLLHHVSCTFKLITMEIGKLEHWKEAAEYRVKLTRIIRHHESCYESARLLESSLCPVMAILYCSCVLQTCYIMFVVSVVEDYIVLGSMMFVLNYTVFMIFTFSMLGTELMETSSAVSNAIYFSRWYEHSDQEQRLLLFMLKRSQKTTSISAAKFFSVTRASFAGAMRSAFSYFTVMQQTINK